MGRRCDQAGRQEKVLKAICTLKGKNIDVTIEKIHWAFLLKAAGATGATGVETQGAHASLEASELVVADRPRDNGFHEANTASCRVPVQSMWKVVLTLHSEMFSVDIIFK